MGLRKTFGRFCGDESGSIALWVGLSMPMVLGIGALAFDMNNMYVTKAELQHTADAAVLAAVKALPDESAAVNAAQTYANLNMPSAKHGTVVSSNDVETGNWDSANRVFTPSGTPVNAVRVSARRDQQNGNPMPTSIGSALGITSVDISASSIAAMSGGGAGGPCLLSLNASVNRAMQLNGDVLIRTIGCVAHVNSNNAQQAILISGVSLVQMIGVGVGSDMHKSRGKVKELGPAFFDPGIDQPPTSVDFIPDPFAITGAFPNPVPPCSDPATHPSSVAGTGGVIQIPQGVYCNGLSITGTGTAEFQGDYFITGGEFFVAGTMNVDGSNGVSFFLTGPDAKINMAGTADVTLKAPDDSNIALRPGFIFIADPGNPSNFNHILRGTAMGGYDGYVYLPVGTMVMAGTANAFSSTPSTCTVIVVDKFIMSGTPHLEAQGNCGHYGANSVGGPNQVKIVGQ